MHLAGTGNQRGSTNGTSPLLPTGIQHHPGNRELIPFSGKTGKTKTSTDSPQTLPQFPNTFQKPHSSTGEPFQTFRKHSVPVACRHGQHPIRTSTACPMRQTKRSPPTIPDETTLTHSGKTKPSRMPQKCGGAYVSVQAHPVADLHFRKQAGPCSLMSWKIPHPDIRIRFCFRACPMLLLRLRQRSGQCGWSMFSHPSTMDKTEYPSPLKQSALFS